MGRLKNCSGGFYLGVAFLNEGAAAADISWVSCFFLFLFFWLDCLSPFLFHLQLLERHHRLLSFHFSRHTLRGGKGGWVSFVSVCSI
jgi:hypothetical protein